MTTMTTTRPLGTRSWHRWTDIEREIVRRDYDGTWATTRRIAERLQVTPHGVRGQAHLLGVGTFWSDRERWTPEQDEHLAEIIHEHPLKVVALKMGRGLNSVAVRAKRLGLNRRERDGWYTKREVCEILGVDHKWVQRRIDEKLLKASYDGAKPAQKGGGYWRIQERDLRQYLIENCGDLNGRNVDLVQIVSILTAQ